jgi:3-isopropylmalate dehydrogenase
VTAHFALLPGDGIGPEVIAEARKVLTRVGEAAGESFTFSEHLVGGIAIDEAGDPLPASTLAACREADAVLLGAVGGPKWDDPTAKTRPEAGLLGLRKELGLYANLRPITAYDELISGSPLRPELVRGVDILFVRELTGGIYFGEQWAAADGSRAHSVMEYTAAEVRRIIRVAANAARARQGKLTSVDKANVLEVSRLWRRVAAETVAEEFPDLTYEVVLVDAMAMHLLSRPRDFDVVVTGNMFGDILTDEGSMLPGSMGLLPSASIGDTGPGLYEPIHGSAPDIAGRGLANPLASILSAAMALRHSLARPELAEMIEDAVLRSLTAGARTADIAGGGDALSTAAMGDAVAAAVGTGR